MTKLRRFILKHPQLSLWILPLTVWAVLTALTLSGKISLEPSTCTLIALAAMLLSINAVKLIVGKKRKEAEKALWNDCDPFPMIDELNEQRECMKKQQDQAGIKLSLASALSLAGDYEKAEELLESINVDSSPRYNDAVKTSVFYCFASLYCSMNLPQHAISFYDKAMEHYYAVPDFQRRQLKFPGIVAAEIECYKGNFEKALEDIDDVSTLNKLQEVNKAFALAKILYMNGDIESAKNEFKWVSKNGNKLAAVKESTEILSAL